MSLRRPHRRERLGRLAGARTLRPTAIGLLVVLLALLAGSLACARYSSGFYHKVRPGENLYRIGRHYGVESRRLAHVNRIRDVTTLRVGQQIWIPKTRGEPVPAVRHAAIRSAPSSSGSGTAARQVARREAEKNARLSFAWPLKHRELTSRFGRRWGKPHEGVDLAAKRGTKVLAAESGKVTHSGRLGDYGNVVILKHAGHYRTVYAHARKLYVKRGQFVEKGQRIAEVGTSGRSSGPHLHFEIRKSETPRDPMLYLP